MNPNQKSIINNFFHAKTVALVLGGKHMSKRMKKEKMWTLFLVATLPQARKDPPGSWIMQIDQKFKEGRE